MLRRQRRAVHLVREQDLVAQCLLERNRALESLLLPALDPAVEPGEQHLDGAPGQPGLLEQRPERRTRPARCPDRLREPRLADRPRLEPRAPVPGALHRDRELDTGPPPELVQSEGELPLPADAQAPDGAVHVGDVVVDQQVVQADRRDRPAQRFQRHPVVPRRQLQLLQTDPFEARPLGHALSLTGRRMGRTAH